MIQLIGTGVYLTLYSDLMGKRWDEVVVVFQDEGSGFLRSVSRFLSVDYGWNHFCVNIGNIS